MIKKKTKIICTIGPNSESEEMLMKLADAGMNVARLNFSHGDHEEQLGRIKKVRKINETLEFPVGILLDTKGPEIRTHLFEGDRATIVEGTVVEVHMNEILGDATKFSITYDRLIEDIVVGKNILVDDGYLILEVTGTDIERDVILTRAVNTHEVKNRRGINVPNVALKLPFISEKDRSDMEFGCEQSVDFIAASFVRCKEDVLEIRELLAKKENCHIQIIAKIENQQGVNNLEEILEVADGVMVARGDLGVEVKVEKVPLIQRQMIEKAHVARKIVITATQMLESMIENVTPTRAEVSDVANAVLDGSDAIMLSGETAMGNHPVLVVETMTKIANTIEGSINFKKMKNRVKRKQSENRSAKAVAMSIAACVEDLPIASVICLSKTGYTARLMSQFRLNSPVLALVENKNVARALTLNYGVYPYVMNDQLMTFETATRVGVEHVMKYKEHLRHLGDRVIVTAGLPFGHTTSQTNTMQILKFKDYPNWSNEWNS